MLTPSITMTGFSPSNGWSLSASRSVAKSIATRVSGWGARAAGSTRVLRGDQARLVQFHPAPAGKPEGARIEACAQQDHQLFGVGQQAVPQPVVDDAGTGGVGDIGHREVGEVPEHRAAPPRP